MGGFDGGNFFHFDHPIQNRVPLDRRTFRIFQRRKPIRTPNQSGQKCRLGQIQFCCVLAEISLGRRFNAVAAGAKINAVHIEFENLLLGEIMLDSKRNHCLEQLSAQIAAAERQAIAGELLGNAAGAFLGRSGQDVAHQRPKNAVPIDARMLIEPGVFTREQRIDE